MAIVPYIEPNLVVWLHHQIKNSNTNCWIEYPSLEIVASALHEHFDAIGQVINYRMFNKIRQTFSIIKPYEIGESE